jgi:probable phosphoglycerate mutase
VRLIVVRHGATEWSRSGQHTGRTDLPLTPEGLDEVRAARPLLRTVVAQLAGDAPVVVCSSPLRRAVETAALMLPGETVATDADLAELDYGRYEGLTKEQIRRERPGWDIWRDGCPDGESVDDVGRRADRFLERHEADATVVAFSHGHTLRILAARALGLDGAEGRRFVVDTASVSAIDDAGGEPAVRLWNLTGNFAPMGEST